MPDDRHWEDENSKVRDNVQRSCHIIKLLSVDTDAAIELVPGSPPSVADWGASEEIGKESGDSQRHHENFNDEDNALKVPSDKEAAV